MLSCVQRHWNITMLLKTVIIAVIAVIGTTNSQDFHHQELAPISKADVNYRPWTCNDTSAPWISLDGMDVARINSILQVNVPGLKWLVMDNNIITTIPSEAFTSLPDLEYISLVRNRISEIASDAFNHLDKLRVIDLDSNPMRQIDTSSFNSLPALESLYLRNCELSRFDMPQGVDKLAHLTLSYNEIYSFKGANNSGLTHLHLNNNYLRYVSLSHFESLTYLNLGRNKLQEIMFKPRFDSVYSVTRYGRRNSYYEENSDSILIVDFVPNLQYLIISFNEISKISLDTFVGAESVVHIDLTGNTIEELYAGTFNNLLKLENILLDSNRITKIDYRAFANLPNLRIISLKNNQISEIDGEAFTKLDSITNEVYLYLDNNKIHTLRRNSFAGIKSLKHIGLSNNKIKIISSYAFADLPSLESLMIGNFQSQGNVEVNQPTYYYENQQPELERGSIESHAFTNLQNLTSIEIRGNLLNDINDQAFHELPKLKLLDLSDNGIENLSIEAFHNLPAIENLYLADNSISKIEPETFPKQLKYLDLAWNNLCPDSGCWSFGELRQLEVLDLSGIIDRFKLDDFSQFPKNLTVLIKQESVTSDNPLLSY